MDTTPEWLEDDEEYEGVGAHEANLRYDPVDETVTSVGDDATP